MKKKAVTLFLIAVMSLSMFTVLLPKAKAYDNNQSGGSTGVFNAVLSGTTTCSTITLGPNPDPMGDTLGIDIYISGASNVWGWIIPTVTWNPAVLELKNVVEGPWLKNNVPNYNPTAFIGNSLVFFDNTNGDIIGGLADAIAGDGVAATSAGVVATLTFTVVGYGTSPITIAGARLASNETWAQNNLLFDAGCNSATINALTAKRQSTVSVSASTNPATANSSVVCTATVSGSDPTGTVTWSSSSGTGSFNSVQTQLVDGTASVSYIDTSLGTATITATYGGDANNAPSSGTATLTMTHGAVSSITVTPQTSSLTSGCSTPLTATAYDAYGNSWNITSLASWSISSGAGGLWSDNNYTSANMGSWTVTASYDGVQGTSSLGVFYVIDYYHTGTVSGSDFFYFVDAYINYWSKGIVDPACDLNHDGVINGADFFLFVADYVAYFQQLSEQNG